MTVMTKERTFSSQFGFSTGQDTAYTEAGGDLAFAVGQIMFFRFATTIPKGSTINTATLTFNISGKNLSAGNYSTHIVRAHASGDSPLLVVGAVEHSRSQTSTSITWTPTWPSNPPGDVLSSIDVKPILQEIMARPDFVTGGYITFMITCTNENGTDMNVRANNVWAPSPKLTVDFTAPNTGMRWEFNRIENSEFSSVLAGSDGTNPVPGWGQNEFYGAQAAPANQGTLAIDTVFTRLPGVPTLRFTTGTPPDPNDRLTGPYSAWRSDAEESTIFCGWIYVASNVPTTNLIYPQEAYYGGWTIVTARGQWVPFCTAPITSGAVADIRWWSVAMRPYQAGLQFWISEPTMITSTFKQMPFNGLTPDLMDGSNASLIDHRSTASRQQSVREWMPRTAIMKNGVIYRAPRYIKRTDGLLQLTEPVKGGVTIGNLGATQVGSLPAQKTVSEL